MTEIQSGCSHVCLLKLKETVIKRRSKPVLTQTWVNDAAYFDGTGFAAITFTDESARTQRFEQEVKLMSHNGVLLLLGNGVKTALIHSSGHHPHQ